MLTERGSEYNIAERKNSRKLTASGRGRGYYNITEPLGEGEGRKENQTNFIGHNENCLECHATHGVL